MLLSPLANVCRRSFPYLFTRCSWRRSSFHSRAFCTRRPVSFPTLASEAGSRAPSLSFGILQPPHFFAPPPPTLSSRGARLQGCLSTLSCVFPFSHRGPTSQVFNHRRVALEKHRLLSPRPFSTTLNPFGRRALAPFVSFFGPRSVRNGPPLFVPLYPESSGGPESSPRIAVLDPARSPSASLLPFGLIFPSSPSRPLPPFSQRFSWWLFMFVFDPSCFSFSAAPISSTTLSIKQGFYRAHPFLLGAGLRPPPPPPLPLGPTPTSLSPHRLVDTARTIK